MTRPPSRPPWLAERLIAWRFTGEARELVLGDLYEDFADRLAAGVAPRTAARRYWRQALGSLLPRRQSSPIAPVSIDTHHTHEGMTDMWLTDLRYAIRLMTKSPWWTLAVVVTVALAIAANTAVFGIVNTVMLRPLPFGAPDRLVWVAERNDRLNLPQFSASVLNYLSWKERSRAVEPMGALGFGRFTLTGQGEPEQFTGGSMTPSLLALLGITPIAGRGFAEGDDRPGAPPVVMISDALWRDRYNRDPGVIGRHLTFNGVDATVVGIAPSALNLLTGGDVWKPLTIDPGREMRLNHVIFAVGRLRPDVTLDQAQREMDAIAATVSQQYPEMKDWGIRLVTFYDWIVNPQLRTTLLVLLAAVGCVLLIASANVANLLLARASARRRELAVRTALGATGRRVLAQLLTESLVLSFAGGLAGVAGAILAVRSIDRILPANVLPTSDVGIDMNVLAFAVGLTLVTGLFFGIAPAWHAARARITDVLHQGRGAVTGRSRLRSVLAGVQLALATVLLVGAGLLTQTVLRLQHVPLGFEPSRVLTFQLVLPPARYKADRGTAFYRELLPSLAAVPGVRSVAMSSGVPFGNGNYTTTPIATRGESPLPPETAIPTDWRIVGPGYFKTMQIPVLRGREFTEAEMTNTAMVVIVSQATARRFWGDADPIGRTLHRQGDLPREYTVVGVVGDVRQTVLNQDRASIYYASSLIGIWPAMDIAVRTDGDPASALSMVRQRVRDLDPNLPLSFVRTMDEWVSASAAPSRLNAILMGAFAAVALVLAAIGIYGVLAYSVTQRTQEIGIRMALGAEPAGVVGLIVRDGLRVGVPGVAAGLAGALALSQSLNSLVYGVTVRDPLTYAGVAAVLGVIALAACVVPARTASRVDPLVALRED